VLLRLLHLLEFMNNRSTRFSFDDLKPHPIILLIFRSVAATEVPSSARPGRSLASSSAT